MSAKTLRDSQGPWKSRMGKAFVGTRAVFRGHDLHTDLKDLDWMELYAFGISGKRFTPEQIELMHAMWVYTSYPDPRIWNNRVAALAGTTRSTGYLGLSAALAVTEATIYGGNICIRAADFFDRACRAINGGHTLADCVEAELRTNRHIYGYGRPITKADERMDPIMEKARLLGLADGDHVRLAFDVESYLLKNNRPLPLNYGGLTAAISLDLGLTPRQNYLFLFPVFLAGMPPCHIEAGDQPTGTLFPLACEQVLYDGADKRPWPKR